jgi:hypothetical protein
LILNLPSAKEMEQTALRIYFSAWVSLMRVVAEMQDEHHEDYDYVDSELTLNQDKTDANRAHFVELAQPDLQLIYSMIQHSQEIALKSKLCEVSPFLLLLGTEVRTWAKPNGDFSTFRTIDASDLLKVADAVFPKNFSDSFKQQYDVVRGGRNKIQHLGAYKDQLDPMVLVDIMVKQYGTLHKNKTWLHNRLSFQRAVRHSAFYDKRWNELTAMFEELSIVFDVFTNRQYKEIFGFSRQTRRYLCLECLWDSKSDIRVHTATLSEAGDTVTCHLCGSSQEVLRHDCRDPECKSNVLTPDERHTCLVCGEDNDDLNEE